MRIAKVRTTNYRQGASAGKSGLDYLSESQVREALAHDRHVECLSRETVEAAARDLLGRVAGNRSDPEQRWVMARKAALLRRISNTPTSR